ncbi:DMT family transporter [Variovorax sp. dw_308]|uniref:DMT family transporter n=1 Tax=Variovorax sp. dw_308 TaxID=2721546 RepID=UPI003528A639
MGELAGVLAAMLSSGLGGTAIGATRYLIGLTDPLTLGAFRFGIGVALLLPVALLRRERWPGARDWPAVAALGLLFFALFPVLFNASLIHTTAARGALALSTLPLLTMLIAALFGVERLTRRKSAGVLIAMSGVALALLAGLANAPAGAWRGDLLMVAAALCMALYSVSARPLMARSGPVAFTAFAMGVGALCLSAISAWRGGFASVAKLGAAQRWALLYLGVFGGAVVFILWAYALERTTPTRVAVSITVNPIMAALVGAWLLREPIGWNLVAGLFAVFLGIWIATTRGRATPGQA